MGLDINSVFLRDARNPIYTVNPTTINKSAKKTDNN